ncbi:MULTISPECIES: GNAT family N-acetyltransferase [unclassified Saccharibacter]|uniref:GNAT family N-acetyltransferase n=1 Tax=unclassified Saccharibacter TaxID=2648722 RepID=UPI0013272EE8|nr:MULTISPECIES: GNAT family N-acetyltransferase [unclassified Saccharibacter]MXV36192.1 GNAT family N-acetyltransferase [Saccharibacter sp. EH611]MXV57052.1 GNAT family N-acetyltransferase [Saccharibacter sp. EH70]MXV66588.1 GNAT family N-acetyltransferase [Saccharibacter sp. EH60]
MTKFSSCSRERSIFHQDWWLECSTGRKISYINVEMGGRVVAVLPFLRKSRFGFSVIKMPKYTRTLGPYFDLPASKTFRRQQNIRHVVDEFVSRLPKTHGIRFFIDPENESAFAFKLAGFKIYQDFTFRVPRHKPLDEVWRDCDQKTRNLIRTAQKKLTIRYEGTVEAFIALSRREVRHNTHDFSLLRKLFAEAYKRGQAIALYAYDGGNLVSAALLIWDDNVLYYWQSVRSVESRVAGKNMLLIWKAIEIAKKRNLIFDFDGFGSVKSAVMLASFGQKPVPQPEIVRETFIYKVERVINNFVRKYITKKSYKYDF